MTKLRNHAPAFKAKVALAALSGHKTIAELSTEIGQFTVERDFLAEAWGKR